jgi:hypothetical protein
MSVKQSNIITSLIIFLISVSILSCNSTSKLKVKEDSKKDTLYSTMGGDTSYFPLIEKGIWEYVNEPGNEKENYKVELKSLTNENDTRIAEYSLLPYFLKNEETKNKLKIKPDGDIYIIENDGSEQLFIPAISKLEPGYRWKCGNWDANVAYINETLKTLYDTYENCIHLNFVMGGMTFSTEIWLAKRRGIVKWGANRTNPPSMNLKYYILKEVNFK